ncbi:inactive pancreatic lipase-related protein 1 [Biomphalaria glabrata]|nr:inactive pancreatic lipase-related protein 1 [Biomphalaria glabrata]
MKEELLLFADYNVILVNWSKGSKAVYHQAVANIRVVGAQIAHLVNTMIESFRMNASDFHIIGHSLGSHTAGYAGERVAGLGRISGLDPAGPLFENTDTRVCLDSSDAMFVDVIHTNGKPLILLGFGTLQPLGHFDFYPNLGRAMPGCIQDEILHLIEEDIPAGLTESVTCSHSKATAYYIESINSKCPYTAYPCDNEEDFKSGKCKTCATHRCVRMGFHAKPRDGRNQKYYLITSDEKQYCQFQYETVIILSGSPTFTGRGHILVNVTGTLGYSPSTKVSPKSRTFRNNQTITFTLSSPSDIGEILSVSLHFDVGRLDSVLGKLLQRSSPRIYINRVVIYRTESNQNVTFCAGDQPIEDHQSVTLDRQYGVADEVCY